MLRQALSTGETLAQKTGQAEDAKLLINAYTRFGDTQLDTGDTVNALDSYGRAQRLAENAAAKHPGLDAQGRLANSFGHLGETLATQGDPVSAIQQYQRGAAILETLVERDQTVRQRRDLRVFLTWLGNLHGNPNFINIGERAKALAYYRRALSLAEAQTAIDPRNARARLDLAVSYVGLGDIEVETDARHSLEYFRQALDLALELLREAPGNFSYLRRQGIYLTKLGVAQFRLGERATALKNLQQAYELFAQLTSRDPADVQVRGDQHANSLALADLWLASREFKNALPLYQQALALAQKAVADSRNDMYAQRRLAQAYAGLGRYHALISAKSVAAERLDHQRQACEWRRHELTVWDNWSKLGTSSVFNQTQREQTARAWAECEAVLFRLTSAKP